MGLEFGVVTTYLPDYTFGQNFAKYVFGNPEMCTVYREISKSGNPGKSPKCGTTKLDKSDEI